jgi:pilus assembly protein CpaE
MNDGIRVLLVDPNRESRQTLLEEFDQLAEVWLAEICAAYPAAAGRVVEIHPDVTVVVADTDPAAAAALISTVVKENPGAVVLSASSLHESATILSLIRAGSREFLTLPVDAGELLATLRRLTKREQPVKVVPSSRPRSAVIAVTGAMGEVGCTTVAVNLATTLAKTSGEDVVLVDFELVFGSIDAQLDVFPENTLSEVVRTIDRLDLTLLKRMLTRHVSGLYVLARPNEIQEAAQLEPESLRQTLGLLREAFPIVVLDTSKALQDSDFLAFEMATTILVVTQFDPTAVRNTARLLDCLREMEGFESRTRLVANRTGSQRASVSMETLEAACGMQVSWQVPNATKIFHAARDRGVPIDAISPRSDAQRVITQIAKDLVPWASFKEAKQTRGFFRERFLRES